MEDIEKVHNGNGVVVEYMYMSFECLLSIFWSTTKRRGDSAPPNPIPEGRSLYEPQPFHQRGLTVEAENEGTERPKRRT